jgi:hypothetical protein
MYGAFAFACAFSSFLLKALSCTYSGVAGVVDGRITADGR